VGFRGALEGRGGGDGATPGNPLAAGMRIFRPELYRKLTFLNVPLAHTFKATNRYSESECYLVKYVFMAALEQPFSFDYELTRDIPVFAARFSRVRAAALSPRG
jgi:hypothetical protein